MKTTGISTSYVFCCLKLFIICLSRHYYGHTLAKKWNTYIWMFFIAYLREFNLTVCLKPIQLICLGMRRTTEQCWHMMCYWFHTNSLISVLAKSNLLVTDSCARMYGKWHSSDASNAAQAIKFPNLKKCQLITWCFLSTNLQPSQAHISFLLPVWNACRPVVCMHGRLSYSQM